MLLILVSAALISCAANKKIHETSFANPYEGGTPADLSGYETMADYDASIMLVETTVAEAEEYILEGKSFVLFLSYADCPYCNRLIPYLNDIAVQEGITVAYINTRKDPTWESNLEIDDYDVFVDRFGSYLKEDEDGNPHLYTPDIYFIRNGEIVARHYGITEGADDPSVELTSEQEDALRTELKKCFNSIR